MLESTQEHHCEETALIINVVWLLERLAIAIKETIPRQFIDVNTSLLNQWILHKVHPEFAESKIEYRGGNVSPKHTDLFPRYPHNGMVMIEFRVVARSKLILASAPLE
jgi:hypothetical protein